MNTIFGIKQNMTSTYDARGRRVAATIIAAPPNVVTQVKNTDSKDGYRSLQLGFGIKKIVKKPQLGHLKKAGVEKSVRWMKEVRVERLDLEAGEEVSIGKVLTAGDSVKVTGVSKGKGFQGGVRRHGFAGGPKTHGQSDRHRAPGSIGQTTTPGRVYKGKRMAGHMGADTSSIRGLEVIKVDKKNNLLTIKGGVPGHIGSVLRIEKLGRIKGYVAPPEEKEEEEIRISDNSENSDNPEIQNIGVSENQTDAVSESTVTKEEINA